MTMNWILSWFFLGQFVVPLPMPMPETEPIPIPVVAPSLIEPSHVYDLQAVILLTSTPGTPVMLPSEEEFPLVREAVHRITIEWEILDTRETSYIFAKRSDYEPDLNLLRRRYQDFKDAPRLNDSLLLPERKVVNELVQFNRAYRKHLVDKHVLEQDRSELYEEVMIETDALYKVWDAVRDARCEFYYVTVRRQALQRLKMMLGEEDYRNVNLPPNVPVWRFNEGK